MSENENSIIADCLARANAAVEQAKIDTNPILKILRADEKRRAAEEAAAAQKRAHFGELRQKLLGWIRIADRKNIQISTSIQIDGYRAWVNVVNPSGYASLSEVDFRGKPHNLGNIFLDDLILEDRAMKFIEDIVNSLEKGTAQIGGCADSC